MKLKFDLSNHRGEPVTEADFRGEKLVMFFYPNAMTPGCTTEACDFRDSYAAFAEVGYKVVGVSPNTPEKNARFVEKEGLNFDLLSDEDHRLAEALGAWGEKNSYGKTTVGLIRSTFAFDEDGELVEAWRNVRAKGHVARIKKELLEV